MKMPPNTPERGDTCRLRGKPDSVGVLLKYNPETNWATVQWQGKGPKLCHRFELECVA